MKEKDKEKFTFVHDIDSDIEETPETGFLEEIAEDNESKFAGVSKLEYTKRTKIIQLIIILTVVSAAIFAFTIWWQKDTSILGICNSLCLIVIIQFFIGWVILMNNLRIFTPLIYGIKSFARMLIGKGMNEDYYTYSKSREENPVPSFYYKVCFTALITAIPAVTLLLIIML